MLTVTVDRRELSAAFDDMEHAIERAVHAGLDFAARATAAQARSAHVYQNRTTDLESSTREQEAEGDVWSDGAFSSVVASETYASYVDDWARGKTGAGILESAWAAVAPRVEHEFEFLLAEACR